MSTLTVLVTFKGVNMLPWARFYVQISHRPIKLRYDVACANSKVRINSMSSRH